MSSLTLLEEQEQSRSIFDAVRKIGEEGQEYWMARDLMGLLGYPRWQEFRSVINRAMASFVANESPELLQRHFSGLTEKTNGRPKEDCKLSRYACYFVAMSGDSRKPEISLAQSYFTIKLIAFDELVKRFTGCNCDIFPEMPSFERDSSGFVYLMEAKHLNRYKIGYSKQVYKRADSMQISSPVEIAVVCRIFSIDAPRLERSLHRHYDTYRVIGEWFELPKMEVSNFLVVANRLDGDIEMAKVIDMTH